MSNQTKSLRSLYPNEVQEAKLVFFGNLPYDNIKIDDGLGADGRPWTQPAGYGFLIHFGKAGYLNALSDKRTFIHELTHAWQGSHGFPMGYVMDSAISQGMNINFSTTSTKAASAAVNNAYNYKLNHDWESYAAEQQAEIVADWYAGGPIADDPRKTTYRPMDVNSPLYRYITGPIRTKPMNKRPDYKGVP